MPSTPFTCCSIGAATVSTTTCAMAPGYVQYTWIVGGVISGYWARGNVHTATAPASAMTIDSTEAKIGLSMKKCANISRPLLIPSAEVKRLGAPSIYFRPLDANQRELPGVLLAVMRQDGRLAPRQVGNARLEDHVLLLPDRPRRPLRLPVHRAVHRQRVVGHGVVVVAAYHPRLVDGQL